MVTGAPPLIQPHRNKKQPASRVQKPTVVENVHTKTITKRYLSTPGFHSPWNPKQDIETWLRVALNQPTPSSAPNQPSFDQGNDKAKQSSIAQP